MSTLADTRLRCIAALEELSGGLQITREMAVDAMLEVVAPLIPGLNREDENTPSE